MNIIHITLKLKLYNFKPNWVHTISIMLIYFEKLDLNSSVILLMKLIKHNFMNRIANQTGRVGFFYSHDYTVHQTFFVAFSLPFHSHVLTFSEL